MKKYTIFDTKGDSVSVAANIPDAEDIIRIREKIPEKVIALDVNRVDYRNGWSVRRKTKTAKEFSVVNPRGQQVTKCDSAFKAEEYIVAEFDYQSKVGKRGTSADLAAFMEIERVEYRNGYVVSAYGVREPIEKSVKGKK